MVMSDAVISQRSVEISRVWHPLLKEQKEEIKREKRSIRRKERERQKVVEQEQRRREESRSPDTSSTVDTHLRVNLRFFSLPFNWSSSLQLFSHVLWGGVLC
jgi:hypothetical protein